ncbi:hypothetical protein QF032_003593 [Streptomyces achromogenes]|nr:hypothetical protein [Streptomyces achromogenes]
MTTTTSRPPRYDEVVAAGAVEVSSREVVRLLTESGLRRRKGGRDGDRDGGPGDGVVSC